MTDWSGYLILFAVGCIAGTLNVIAGGGSFITLPVLIFMGLPPSIANATNRVAIVLQNVGAVWSFSRHGISGWPYLLWAALPATCGAIFGSWAALVVSDESFKTILVFLMVGVTLWTFFNPIQGNIEPDHNAEPPRLALVSGFLFFLTGIYGGFVQAGVGFFLLAATTMIGVDLVRGNAIKVLSILCFTSVALAIFAWQGKVQWWIGLTLGGGTVLGGLLGVRFTVLKGHAWVRAVVIATIILFALRLWLAG